MPAVPFKELTSKQDGTSSADMRREVSSARELQTARFAKTATRTNAQMTSRQIRQSCPLDEVCTNLLRQSINELGLSARAHDKVLRVARTIADLEHSEAIRPEHLSEAVNYRMLDRGYWK
ncbi:hypothetical protein [Aeoliella sp.]|uniref:magnesium chelatase subunit ChlI family protein n=1 Tax=Aeoliella sp. TaxID=2795800 RepID=UPI003CCBF513